jgi:uncharacterized membrane protein YkvA (DUF1232 family)
MKIQFPEKLRALALDAKIVWIAARDRRTPVKAKVAAGLIAAYLVSPIDIIPDFIPLVGWLDDILIARYGVAYVLRQLPPELLAEFRAVASGEPATD